MSFQIGRDLDISYSLQPSQIFPVQFHITRGYLKGHDFLWTQELLTTGIPPEEPDWLPPGLALRFQRNFWHIIPGECTGSVLINGQPLANPALLRINDEITFEGCTIYID